MKLEKPTILLHEGDYSEMLNIFREECLTYCSDAKNPGPTAILNHFSANASILWLDAGAFCAASLKMIYMQILTHLPHYRAHPFELSNGIVIPGEQGPDSLQNHVNVLVCKENPGAEALAEETKDSLLCHAVNRTCQLPLSRALRPFRDSPLINIINAEEYVVLEQNERDGSEVSASSKLCCQSSDTSTVLLLYLNEDFFEDDSEGILRHVVRSSIEDPNIRIVLVHEQDVSNGGCLFSYYFGRVPQDLIDPPCLIFKDIAISLYPSEEYRAVSISQIISQYKLEKNTKEQDERT